MKTQPIGTELEFTGISRYMAAKVIAKFFHTREHREPGTYGGFAVKDGAKVNETCGLHVHIGAADLNAKQIRVLVNTVESRYTILNLHALFTKGTIEFRIFNASLHAGEVKAAIQFSAALVAFAKKSQRAVYRKVETDNEKFAMRTFLTRLGLNGDEFKSARLHLTKNLEGNAAWRFAV